MEPRIPSWIKKQKLILMDWRVAYKYKIADWLDVIHEAIKLHESRKSWWDRWGKRILGIVESLLKIFSKIL